MASSLVAKFPGGKVTASSSKGGGLGYNSTGEVQNACFWLEICSMGTCWG